MKTRVYSGGATASGSPRRAPGDPDKLSTLMFTLPLGVGKPYDVKPAFKPDSATLDSRNIDSSSFIGFAVEGRLMRYLRIFGDWTVYNHSTLAAKASLNAPAVDLPGVASVISSSDIRYDMTTHGFRLGGKLGFPLGSHVEPWIGGGGGFYVWSASYQDKEGFYSYGDDHGVELGLTGMGGVDFTMNAGGLLLRLTPYGELGAPVVHPTISDIGGTGGTWHDNQGTAVMVPRRLGLMLSLGF